MSLTAPLRLRVEKPKIRLRVLPKLIPLDGKSVEMQTTVDYIQWRLVGDTAWTNLIALSEIAGPKGNDGSAGPANSLSIGAVDSGSEAAATITGDAPSQTLNLTLPKGDKGDTGATGAPGTPGADGTDGTNGADGADGVVQSITAGAGISVDSTDPANPKVTAKSMVVRTQVFSASGTYTPNANMLFCVIEAVGGGGGGGGVVGTAGSVGIGSGGGAGGYSRTTASKSTIGSSKGVTIGAGGTGGAGTSAAVAGSGGDTSVATLCIAKGGGGGQAAKGDTRFATKGGVGGVAGTGDFTASGEAGCGAFAASISTVMAFSGGTGGSGMFGTGGPPVFNNDGGAATGYGAGGGGALQTTTANQVGGAGASGVVIITEYCSE